MPLITSSSSAREVEHVANDKSLAFSHVAEHPPEVVYRLVSPEEFVVVSDPVVPSGYGGRFLLVGSIGKRAVSLTFGVCGIRFYEARGNRSDVAAQCTDS